MFYCFQNFEVASYKSSAFNELKKRALNIVLFDWLEIFNKCKEVDGKFNESFTKDRVGLLSLYEAAHLRTNGEVVLDKALDITTCHLNSITKSLGSGSLPKWVKHALELPLHKGMLRIEPKHFIYFYEDSLSRNNVLI